uniref:N-acetyltransferase domain-containing protein n=1 Tax=Rhizophora mucronata TaxID=61149 RepID=A0A2P2NMJ3_RHIMU
MLYIPTNSGSEEVILSTLQIHQKITFIFQTGSRTNRMPVLDWYSIEQESLQI